MLRQAGSYTNFFADALIAEADRDARVIGIHAAMGGGTGMNRFEQRFPDRTFDVGIAEQVGGFAVLLGGVWRFWLGCSGTIPVVPKAEVVQIPQSS